MDVVDHPPTEVNGFEAQGLLSAQTLKDEGEPPRFPLMGAWICETFSPWLMPFLYGLAGLALRPARGNSKTIPGAAELVEQATAPYSSSIYPILALALERHHFLASPAAPLPCFDLGLMATGEPWLRTDEQSLAGETDSARLEPLAGTERAHCLAVVDPEALPFEDQSLGTYRMNNVIHRYADRLGPLNEAFRVLKPGGILQLTDNTAGWVESMWPAWLAGRLGLHKLKRKLIRGKLLDTHQVLAPAPAWWQQHTDTNCWELVEVRPFFSRTSMRLASLFESLNFKQGGSSPIWIEEKLRNHRWLASLYRGLLRGLSHQMLELDEHLTHTSGEAFLLVTLRKRGQAPLASAPPQWRCPACHGELAQLEGAFSCGNCSTNYLIKGGIAQLEVGCSK